jgi:hypothetical protein
MSHDVSSRTTRRTSDVVLTLIAEVLAGETLITPGGAVDCDTACSRELFTWDGWLEQLRDDTTAAEPTAEVAGTAATPAEAFAD